MTTTLRPDARLRVSGDGRVLIGGSPLRMLRLSPAGARQVRAWLDGEPVGAEPAARALARRIFAASIAHPQVAAGHYTRDDVTVVVPVKDNPSGLARLLAATGEVRSRIVVDDGSAEPVAGAVRHESARGPAAARNSGYRSATTELIAFLDSDIVPDPGWLDTVLPLFEDPAVAAVAPRVRTLARGALGRYETHRSSLDMGPEPAVVRPGGRIAYVPTAALVIRRTALAELGGFDETLRYGEDVDLIWRLVAAGRLVRYQPDAVVRHEPRATLRDWLAQRYAYGTSAAELAARHPGQLYCARMPWPTAFRWLAIAAGRPLPAVPTLAEPVRRMNELRAHGLPLSTAAAVIGDREVSAVRQAGDALRRIWWPAALLTRRGRYLLAATYLPVAIDAAVRTRDPRAALLRIADDLAYGCGVWSASLRSRKLEPLLPQLIRNGGTDATG
ncbi:putative glycosyltransferase [Nocardia nova SH22a]|uniref:Putative glycosyltransferase n=1 Tax=Nocardia nova SH22a TaxID=1415166 RepID=W5TMQ1_9NOCA|nr:mycofactocin biosynthesis glycosyltransferase MftF [Nocardia nova]AHH20542.1 putative glycosyltransferase [Nocardia nova SH22a]